MVRNLFELIIIPLCLLIFGAILIWPLFGASGPFFVNSIEVSYVQAGKFFAKDFPIMGWNSLWYAGFPNHVLYNPIFPAFEAGLNSFFGLNFGQAYWLIVSFGYILLPVTFYYFLRYLTKSFLAGFLGGIAVSFLPSFAYLFSGISETGQAFSFAPWRLIALIFHGEGPHIFSLFLIPLAGLAYLHSLRKPGLKTILLSSFLISLVALTNNISFLGLVILLSALFLSEFIRYDTDSSRIVKVSFITFLLAFGLSSFWFNFSFLKASLNFGGVGGIYQGFYSRYLWFSPLVLSLFLLPILQIFNKRTWLQPLLVGILWFLPMFIFIFIQEKWGRSLFPLPQRFIPELDLAVWTILAVAFYFVFKKFYAAKKFFAVLFLFSILFLIILVSWPLLQNSRQIFKGQPLSIEDSFEYEQQLAKKIEKIVSGQRLFATGNNAFYLNFWTDVPQLRGGLDQAATNPWWNHVAYQLNRGEDPEISLLLSRAMNLNYILVNFPESRHYYSYDFWHPEKFEKFAAPIFAQDGDVLYKVPLAQPGLAQVVNLDDFFRLKEPFNAVDRVNLLGYANWVDYRAKSVLKFEWAWPERFEGQGKPIRQTSFGLAQDKQGRDRILVEANFQENEALSLQITYDRGWKAKDCNGQNLKIKKDVMGNMVIIPKSAGFCPITLDYGIAFDRWLGYFITAFTLLLILWRPKWFKKRFEFGEFQPPRVLKPGEYEIRWRYQ